MSLALYQVDAFTNASFAGNPAAVCVLPASRGAAWMQNVAAEMNLSETAFLRRQASGTYALRWFTPASEVDLCGHATLASAHVLWTEGFLASDEPAVFETNSGELQATRTGSRISLDFPTDTVQATEPPTGLSDALGISDPAFVGRSDRDLLVQVHDAATVRSLAPDLNAIASFDARGVVVTAPAPPNSEADLVSRFFAPAVDVPEDPVTGSTHCALGPYWAARLGSTTLTGRQVSARGGTVEMHLDAPSADRITLGGQATTVVRGRLDV